METHLNEILSPYILFFHGRECINISKVLDARLGIGEEAVLDFIKKNPDRIASALENETDEISLPTKGRRTLSFQSITASMGDCTAVFLSEHQKDSRTVGLDPGVANSIITHSANGCIVMQKGIIVYSNARFAEFLGYAKKEIIGKPFLSFVSKGYLSEFISVWVKNPEKLKKIRNPKSLAQTAVRIVPGRTEIQISDVVFRTKDGRLLYATMRGDWHQEDKLFWAEIIDSTEREEIKTSLRASEKRFNELFDRSPVGIIYLTPKGHIKDCNRFASGLIGYPKEEIRGVYFTKFVSPAEEKHLTRDFEKLYARGMDLRGRVCNLISKQGKPIMIEYSAQLVIRKGHKTGALMMFTDVTEKKALEEALVSKNIEMGKTLEKMTKMKDDLEARATELHSATEKLKDLNETLSLLSITDGLTGIYNHRYFQERLSQEANRIKRYREDHLSLLMLDVDDFKKVNDSFGHQNGDVVLKKLAQLLMENVRNIDIVARYGGEEFAIILPKTDSQSAYLASKRIKDAVASTPFPIGMGKKGGKVSITVSIGAATIEGGDGDATDLIRMADHALYAAKAKGKNIVEARKK